MNRLFVFIIFTICVSCSENADNPVNAEIFGPDKISSTLPEFGTSVNSDQTEVYFNRTTDDRSIMQIMHAVLKNDVWSDGQNLPFSSGAFRDVDPFLTQDGNRLYFSSTRPTLSDSVGGNYNTWYVERKGNGWSEPINPGYPLNSDSTEIFISLTKEGDAYFVSERDGIRGIVVSRYKNGQYQDVERITLKLRGQEIYASNPCISSDGKYLIVAARDPEGNGAPDLFFTKKLNGEWSELINLGPKVNSPYADFAPALSKDDRILYFTSERPGIVPALNNKDLRPPGDIYSVNIETILKFLN